LAPTPIHGTQSLAGLTRSLFDALRATATGLLNEEGSYFQIRILGRAMRRKPSREGRHI
jgi:hypothetical protein